MIASQSRDEFLSHGFSNTAPVSGQNILHPDIDQELNGVAPDDPAQQGDKAGQHPDKREVAPDIEATDPVEVCGKCRHVRVIVTKEKQGVRLRAKAQKAAG